VPVRIGDPEGAGARKATSGGSSDTGGELDGEREPLLPALLRCGTLASCVGSPALSVPCGFVDGLPVGLQLIGRRWDEAFLLELGRRYESVHEWPLRLPPDVQRVAGSAGCWDDR
jgi:Asp-tRNA(Asn)/Glu-tRNA(Gln) amidotransferase A subunit family amidase